MQEPEEPSQRPLLLLGKTPKDCDIGPGAALGVHQRKRQVFLFTRGDLQWLQSRWDMLRWDCCSAWQWGFTMLVLSRKVLESIQVGDDIVVSVVQIRGGKVRIGIEAPKHVPIMRAKAAFGAGALPGSSDSLEKTES